MGDLERWQMDLKSHDVSTRMAAAEHFSQAGEDAAFAALELVHACGDDESVNQFAIAALEDMGPPPADSKKALSAFLTSPESLVAYWAATLIGRLEETAKDCQADLAALLTSSADMAVRERAAWALGRVGADSESAIAALKEAARSGPARLQRLATAALEQLNA
jgi:HEAT repeat protein